MKPAAKAQHRLIVGMALAFLGVSALPGAAPAASCDRSCLQAIGDQYRAAWLAHDPKKAPFAAKVRFTENNVEMAFPDGTWDTITKEYGPPLTLADPETGQVGIYTAFSQKDTGGFVAIRLKVVGGRITEVEHIVNTLRTISGPPAVHGDPTAFAHEPRILEPSKPGECGTRAEMVRLADGYFSTLEHNNGQIRNTRFLPDATRSENGGKVIKDIEGDFKTGRYAVNDRVRDREYFLFDPYLCIVMSRGFIDHKGVLDDYKLTDGTPTHAIYREPHTWALLEMFKMKNGAIADVKATFFGAPYYQRSPWTKHPDPVKR